MRSLWARILVPLVAVALLTSCTSTITGHSVAVRGLAGGGALEFREVITSTAGQPPPSRMVRQPDPVSACQTYKADLDRHTPPGAQLVSEAKACRQHPGLSDPEAQAAALATLDCGVADPLAGKTDPALPLATCDRDGAAKHVLSRVFLTGKDLADARAELDTQGVGWVVLLSFTSRGSQIWADYTTRNVHKQVAILLDDAVLSAPEIQEPIVGGETRISGGAGGFTEGEARELIARLGGR